MPGPSEILEEFLLEAVDPLDERVVARIVDPLLFFRVEFASTSHRPHSLVSTVIISEIGVHVRALGLGHRSAMSRLSSGAGVGLPAVVRSSTCTTTVVGGGVVEYHAYTVHKASKANASAVTVSRLTGRPSQGRERQALQRGSAEALRWWCRDQ